MKIDIDKIKWLFDNSTSYQISKRCAISAQSVDRYKHGQYDLLNMKLKTAIELTEFANQLMKDQKASLS
ncbi:hypothetical protein [Streptococcus sp. DD13]|uniref:hypothetical protein n=1 Tax=Streptococcus sp. DD13 TaxID=1777881 RepID=UPI00079C3104|nr:hypothetical protein [Streptococcus sp. DD13]KXT78369.1 hypothetical protein STRDD13_00774 [Streptococcus sp. DD13]